MRRYFIHIQGKVGSQTLETSIRTLDPEAVIERHHVVSDVGLQRRANATALASAKDDPPYGNAHQLQVALAFRRSWQDWPDDAWVIFGTRAPLPLAISSVFQNARQHFPWATFDVSNIEEETDRALSDIDILFEESIKSSKSTELAAKRTFPKIEPLDCWIKREIFDFHGVDVFAHDIGEKPFIVFEHGRRRFLVYRQEDLHTSLPDILEALGLPRVQMESINIGEAKPTGNLYKAVVERFNPKAHVVDFFNGQRYVEHFYSGANARHLSVLALKDVPLTRTLNNPAIEVVRRIDDTKTALLETKLQSVTEDLERERALLADLKSRLLQLQDGFDEASAEAIRLARDNSQIRSDLVASEQQRSQQDDVFSDVMEKSQSKLAAEIERRDCLVEESRAACTASNAALTESRSEIEHLNERIAAQDRQAQAASEDLAREHALLAELKSRLLQLQVGFDEISSRAMRLAEDNSQIRSDLAASEQKRSQQDEIFSDILEKAQARLIAEIERRDRLLDASRAELTTSDAALAVSRSKIEHLNERIAAQDRQVQSASTAHETQVRNLSRLIAESAEANSRLKEELATIYTALQQSRYLRLKRWLGRLVGR